MKTQCIALLNRNKKFSLLAAALFVLAAPILLAQSPTPPAAPTPPNATPAAAPLAFDAISIHPTKIKTISVNADVETTRMVLSDPPDGYHVENGTLKFFIMEAYGVKWDSIVGGPDWIDTTGYDIDAKVTPAVDAPPPKLNRAERRQMIQSMLADRFKLVVHNETKDAPIYELDLAKGGSKLPIATPNDTFAKGINGLDGNPVSSGYPVMLSRGRLFGQSVTIASLIDYLKQELKRPVVDKTGLTGKYDLSLQWTPDNTLPDSPLAGGPSIFTAVQEQLGLKLTSTHGPVKTLVIDHVEPPSPN
ncbi:MAG: TIGR03435 family protein [Acidobacteriaceae bacterium]